MNIEEMSAKDLLYYFVGQSYTCLICHKIIYPMITEIKVNPISLSLTQDKTQARGGRGNKVKLDNICPECGKAMTNK